jgi:signal transduction histidine kinase/tRNA A-37 threonylcarbamoyl transferase component Bud32
MAADIDRHLLFGLLALQNGLIDQVQLVAAFQAWTRDRGRDLADHLVARGDLDADQRAGVEMMVGLHLKKHGGDAERSLAAVPAGRSIREGLAKLGDPGIDAPLAHVGSGSADSADGDRTATYAVGTATSDGQRFRILRPHARGGLGEVFVALDGELNREVALKRIRPDRAADPSSRARFLLEAEVTGHLEHPGVVPVYSLGVDGSGWPFYVMRLVKGDTLKQAVDRFHRADQQGGRDPKERDLALWRLLGRFLDVCNAIEYAHSRGILHRDLKPQNVVLGPFGETLVVDWGLAKVGGRRDAGAEADAGDVPFRPSAGGSSETQPGATVGTPAYMSPEQAAGRLDLMGPASDVYGLGATLYYLLTGRPPYQGADIGRVLREVRHGLFPRPGAVVGSVDPALEDVCLKAMARDPAARYPSARALALAVEHSLTSIRLREPTKREQQMHEELQQAEVQLVSVYTLHAAGMLAAGVSFEVGNPLASVSEDVEALQRDIDLLCRIVRLYQRTDDALAAHSPELLGLIRTLSEQADLASTVENIGRLTARSREGLERARQVIKDLRDFACIDVGGVQPVDLNVGIAATVNIILVRAKELGIEVDTELNPLPPVTCHPGRINQVVMNLLANAIDACPHGGRVTVATRRGDDDVEIHVSDTGGGIAPDVLNRIFLPFFTTKPHGQWTGLGLSISYGIVRSHGGRIDVHSTIGQGSRFVIRLPIRQPGVVPPALRANPFVRPVSVI